MHTAATKQSARNEVESLRGKHVVVFGDLMLDEFLQGDVSRISPEAPVPVVELQLRELRPGGAANAAANLVSLGASCTVLGRIGNDGAGSDLTACMNALGNCINKTWIGKQCFGLLCHQ